MGTKQGPFVFEHRLIDHHTPGMENDICLIGDINGNSRDDILIGGKYGYDNVVWYENPTWERHTIATAHLEAGGVLVDVNGNGRLDLVAGNPYDTPSNRELYWFECPEDPRQPWIRHVIITRFLKYHDQAVGDVDGDGEIEVLFASQKAKVLGYFDIPADPTVSPWPDDHCHLIAQSLVVEGLCILDLDGDGVNEVIAGPNIFKRSTDGEWTRIEIAPDFQDTRVAVADLDGDGVLDIVLTEAESDDGRVAWLKGPHWERTVLGEHFFNPHSLEVADFDGDGLPDIFVGEMGLHRNLHPREVIFHNQGNGRFRMYVIGHLPTHQATVGDISGNGLPDIVGKPYLPGNHVDLWLNHSGGR